MTPRRQKQLLEGQTNIAQKIYEHVPMQDAWTLHVILNTLSAVTRSKVGNHVARGCIAALIADGLVRQVGADRYRRVEIRAQREEETEEMPTPITLGPRLEAVPVPVPVQPAAVSAIDVLAPVSQRLRAIGATVNEVADQLDGLALAIEEGAMRDRESGARLRQLQDLLRSAA